MQNRNDEPRLQHAPLRLPRKDDGRGRVNRRAMGVGRVSEWRKVTSQKPGGNFRQPQSEAEDRTIWPCRDHERRSSYHRRIFFEVPHGDLGRAVSKRPWGTLHEDKTGSSQFDNWLSNRIFNPTTTSSIIAVTHGTNSSICPGR